MTEARDGYEAVRLARELQPDVLLVDASLGGQDMSSLYELLDPESGCLVVRLIERPQEHAGSIGISVLKGVPSRRIRQVILEALKERDER